MVDNEFQVLVPKEWTFDDGIKYQTDQIREYFEDCDYSSIQPTDEMRNLELEPSEIILVVGKTE